jgi:hypothetical protein
VHAGVPEQRAALARRLFEAAVQADDVELLGDHCRGTVEGAAAAARVLVSLLVDDAKRTARLADLRVVRDAQARRAAAKGRAPGDTPASPAPLPGEDREVWDHDRQCRIAWCRVNGDHRSEAEVAAELGVKPGTLRAMLDRGRALSASPIVGRSTLKLSGPGDDAKVRAAAGDRTDGFRERMRMDARKASPKASRNVVDHARMLREMEALADGVRKTGKVDLRRVLADKTRLGALATLEADGVLLRTGEPDLHGVQPYAIANSDAQRAEFRDTFRAWAQKDRSRARDAQEATA